MRYRIKWSAIYGAVVERVNQAARQYRARATAIEGGGELDPDIYDEYGYCHACSSMPGDGCELCGET